MMTETHLTRAFEEFHATHPHVYELFCHFAHQAALRGRRVGAYAIWERMRWYSSVESNDEPYKLNNNHVPYYARMFMRDNPLLDGFFNTRSTLSEREEEEEHND